MHYFCFGGVIADTVTAEEETKNLSFSLSLSAATNMQQSHSAIAPRALNIAIINNINAAHAATGDPPESKTGAIRGRRRMVCKQSAGAAGCKKLETPHTDFLLKMNSFLCVFIAAWHAKEHLSFSFLLSRRIPPPGIVKRQKSLFELRKPGRFLSEKTPLLLSPCVSDVTESEVMAKMRATYTQNTKVTLIPMGWEVTVKNQHSAGEQIS
jgi:hypothetical protein